MSVTIEATGTGSEQILAGSNNSYSGLTEVASGTLGAGAELPSARRRTWRSIAARILDMNGFDNEVNTLSGSGTVENSAADTSATLGVGNDSTGSTFTGTLTDAGGGTGLLGLAKLGTDTITIAGTNSYSGPTIVEGGTLSIPNSLGSSPVQWAGGQTAGLVLNPSSYATAVTLALATGVSNPVVSGQSVAFTATVSTVNNGYGPPTGWVDFYDEATDTDSGEIGVVGGEANWTLENPALGTITS